MKKIAYILAFVLAGATNAWAADDVTVDFASLPSAPVRMTFTHETGINSAKIGMSLNEIKDALIRDGYEIKDQRLVVASASFEPDGVSVEAYSEKFIGRVFASKESPTDRDAIQVFFTSPISGQKAFYLHRKVSYLGKPLDFGDVLPAMTERYGEPSLNKRKTAIRYVSWYKDAQGNVMSNFDRCLELPDMADGLAIHYNMTHLDYAQTGIDFFNTGCGAFVAAIVNQTIDKSREDVDGFSIKVFDNGMRAEDVTQSYNALSQAVNAKNIKMPQASKPKF